MTSAKLRLYATDATVNGPAVYTTGTTWQESTITYANQPGTQTLLSIDKARRVLGYDPQHSWRDEV